MKQNELIKKILSVSGVQKTIIQLIQQRLINEGTYSTGEEIITYKAKTEAIGQNYARNTIFGTDEYKGKYDLSGNAGIWEHVTLYNTGQFYSSMLVIPQQDQAIVYGNSQKPDGLISDNLDTNNILSLDEAGLNVLRYAVKIALQKSIRDYLKKEFSS